jgi:hypothetical protein
VRPELDEDEPAGDEGLRPWTEKAKVPAEAVAGPEQGAGTGRPPASVYVQSLIA